MSKLVVLFIAALVMLGGAFAFYSSARTNASFLLRQASAAQERGDCQSAMGMYRSITSQYTLFRDAVEPSEKGIAECELQFVYAAQASDDCQTARKEFNAILSKYSKRFPHVGDAAKLGISECEDLERADLYKNRSDWPTTVGAYAEFRGTHPNSVLIPVIRNRLDDLQSIAISGASGGQNSCQSIAILDAFMATGEPMAPAANESYSTAIFSCGDASLRANDLQKAIDMFARFAQTYPNHPRAAQARKHVIDTEVTLAKTRNPGVLPPISPIGRGSGGIASIQIINDSPYPLEILFSGSRSDTIVLPPCAGCQTYRIEPSSCPNLGPRQSIDLPPGDYSVLARRQQGASVTPYVGVWQLASGFRYSECYYVMSTFG